MDKVVGELNVNREQCQNGFRIAHDSPSLGAMEAIDNSGSDQRRGNDHYREPIQTADRVSDKKCDRKNRPEECNRGDSRAELEQNESQQTERSEDRDRKLVKR